MSRLRHLRNRVQLRADQLETALESGVAAQPSTDNLLAVSRLLTPTQPVTEDSIRSAEDRALRAFRAASLETKPAVDAGALAAGAALEVHTAEVELPDGRIVMADVERIDPDRAERVAQDALDFARDREQ
jgi:non-canonical (house-cleaning) NTP pyrophosphatase